MSHLSSYSIHRLRVFSACVMCLLMPLVPMTPLFVSANTMAAASAEQQAESTLAQNAKTKRTPRTAAASNGFAHSLSPQVAGPIVSGTLRDSFVDTAPSDGRADAGSTVTYTAVISNTGGAAATGVTFTDNPDSNTTLVGGSVKISPLAFADSYNAVINTPLNIGAPGVLTNDTGTPAPTAVPIAAGPTTQGGTVTLNADGSFTYNPPNPGFSGADTFTYFATNGQAPDDSTTVTISVGCTFTVTNPATNTGTVDAAFSQTFTQTGGVGTITFSLNSGTLPTGLTVAANGTLSGTPTQAGSFPITVKATDSNGCTGISPTYNLTIACQTITVTKPVTTTGTVDASFSQTFTQTGAHGTATFTTASTLPTGLTLSTGGLLSGTPTVSGTFPIVVTVTDSNGCTGASSTYTLVINCQTITVTKPVTTTGTVDAAFSQNFTQTGAHGTATFTTASTLPAGLSLATTGTLSGTPTQSGSFPIVVTVTDSNGCTGTSATYTLVINCQTITVTKPATTTGTVSTPFSQTFTQTGAHGTATFTTASTLPTGLSLATGGTLSGTPTQTGSFPIVVTVTDSNGCTGSSSTYTLVIGCQSITVTKPATTTGTVDAAFSQTFTQTGAQGTATFTLNSGSLPSGLSLSTGGVLSGAPTQSGSFPITVKVTDSNGCFGVSSTYTLVIGCQTITVTNPGVTTGTVDATFSQTFTQTGAHGAATFTKTGALPSGMSFSAAGVLSGTPGQPGSFPITVTVTDSNGCTGTSATYTLVITCQTITVTNPGVTTGTVDAPFSQTFTQSGVGTHTPATFTTASTLPSGLTLSTAGVLSGTPGQPGTFPIVVTVTDANGCTGTSATYNLVIACQTITVTNPASTTAIYTTALSGSFTFTQTGVGTHTPVTLTVNSGTLPNGVSLSSAGVLSGTPTQTGIFSITAKVTDANGCTGTSSTYTLSVGPKLVAETYSDVGNTQLAGGVAAPATPSVSVVSVANNDTSDAAITYAVFTGPTKGTLTAFNNTGTFLYTPNAGNTLTDTFTYSGTSNGVTVQQTATINFSNRVWYVNSSGSNGDGRSNTPFNTMTGAGTAANAVNDFIFVHTGGATTTGSISLLDGQTLWGQGTTFVLGPLTIASGTKPTLTGTVTLGGNNDTVSSLDLSTVGSTGITNTSGKTGALVENNVTVTTTTGTGVLISGIAGTLTFTGLSTNGGTGASLTGSNASATFNFSNVTISSAANAGFTSTGGGTLSITGATNTITSTTGTALNVANTTIGASGLTFVSISANGGSNGIILNTTGASGGLTVTGDGSNTSVGGNSTGGTIQNMVGTNGTTAGSGIYLNSTKNVVLRRMTINGTNSNFGIRGFSVSGFTLEYSTVSGTNGVGDFNTFPDDSGEGSVYFGNTVTTGIIGSGTFTNNNINGGAWDNMHIENTSGTATITVKGNTFGLNGSLANGANISMSMLARGSGTIMNAVVGGSAAGEPNTYTGAPGGLANFTGEQGTTMDVQFKNNIMSNSHPNNNVGGGCLTLASGGTMTFNADGNSMRDANGSTITIQKSDPLPNNTVSTSLSGRLTNNTLGVTGVVDSASKTGNGIFLSCAGKGTVALTITGNSILNWHNNAAMFFDNTGGSYAVNLTIQSNIMAEPGAGSFASLALTNGAQLSADTVNVCAVIGGAGALKNTITGTAAKMDLYLVSSGQNGGHTFNLPGYAGVSNLANVQTFVTSNNTFSGGAVVQASDDNGGQGSFTGTGTNCGTPLMLARGGVESSLDDLFVPFRSGLIQNTETDSARSFAGLNHFSPWKNVATDDALEHVLASSSVTTPALEQQQLDSIVSAARQRWIATGLTPQQLDALNAIKFEMSDLHGTYLGEAAGNQVLVDRRAEGKGWFVDANPLSDSNFARAVSATRRYTDPMNAAAGHVDLLTAIEHEMGHRLGLDDSYLEKDRDNLMYGYLTVGERRLPAPGQAKAANPNTLTGSHFLSVGVASAQRGEMFIARATGNGRELRRSEITPATSQNIALLRSAGNHLARRLYKHSVPTGLKLMPLAPPPPPGVNANIGNLPAGKSVTITFQVTLNTSIPGGTSTVSTQGNITGGNFATVPTDDPDTGPVGDATVTPIDAPTAANSNVSGQIVDAKGNPVEGAAVRMTGTQNRLTVTDANGSYHFDDVETNGFYTVIPSRSNFNFSPTQRAFSQLGQHTDAAFSATTNGSTLNPLDTTEYFVRQQYVDFLNREPDESGFNFWVNNIESCGNDANCRAIKRTDTSAAFFLSTEFQQTGYLVYRTYQAAFGDIPGAPVPLRLSEFKPDAQAIGNGVVVLQSGWETVLENNKQAFAAEFVQRPRFTSAYPGSLTPSEFVDQLFTNAGVVPSDIDRATAISEFGSATTSADTAARGRALRRVAENSVLAQQEFNQAFVAMEYFGYLRRDANSGPDTDFSGYNFWMDKLNTFGGDFENAEMVKSFLVSGEYRGRFPR